MGFYHTTENPCVMMRVNHKTKSCECIIMHQDELYIASSTLQEILHIVKDKYKIKINPHIGSLPELCIYFTFICITFHLHYICISFTFCIAPGIDIFALHFITISKCQINVK